MAHKVVFEVVYEVAHEVVDYKAHVLHERARFGSSRPKISAVALTVEHFSPHAME